MRTVTLAGALPSGSPLFAAFFADTVNLEGVTRREVVVSMADFLLQFVYVVRKKLNRAAAFRANHMVMAAAIVLMLVPGNPVVESDFAGQAAFG